MESYDVNRILNVFHSKDWSNYYDYQNVKNFKKNIWFKINNVKEFDFVRDIITTDIKKIDSAYEVSEWITFLIYEKGDFFNEHEDARLSTYISEKTTLYSGGYLLNDSYSGGDFIINGEKLNCEIGELFYFGRDITHRVDEVKSGIRYSLHFAINTTKIINKSLI